MYIWSELPSGQSKGGKHNQFQDSHCSKGENKSRVQGKSGFPGPEGLRAFPLQALIKGPQQRAGADSSNAGCDVRLRPAGQRQPFFECLP